MCFLIACSSSKLQLNKISGYQEVYEGDSCVIAWDFSNAKYVEIPPENKRFNARDSFVVRPYNSIRYDIIAYSERGDSLIQYVYIVVKERAEAERRSAGPIQRGPLISPNVKELQSKEHSEYFSGMLSGSLDKVAQMKISYGKLNAQTDSIELYFLLLDEFGNFIQDITNYTSDVRIELAQGCGSRVFRENLEFPRVYSLNSRIACYLLVDKGILLDGSNPVAEISEGVQFLSNEDGFSLSIFGNDLETLIPIENFDKGYWDLQKLALKPETELSAIYKSLYNLMFSIPDSSNSIVILITNNTDNASITYTLEDVLEIAKKKGISLNVVGVGNEFSLSAFKYVTALTLGTTYHLFWNDFGKISDVLREIILSRKFAYRAVGKNRLDKNECKEGNYRLTVRGSSFEFSDFLNFPFMPKTYYTNYQAVSLFNFLDTTLGNEYLAGINNLAKILKEHPDISVELVGNASLDEYSFKPLDLSLARANSVKEQLLNLGVNFTQIKAKGRGTSKPLFQIEEDERSKMLNRRVEIRWLHPSVLPYTVVVDTLESEEQAENQINVWERRGFKAYYDRILEGGDVRYRIVLWGYSNFEEAERTARLVFKKFKTYSVVE